MRSADEGQVFAAVRLRPRPDLATAWTAVALGAVAVLLLAKSMGGRVDHDEHQFVASAALLARRGLLPYRDYPYFHTPYLVFVYALLFRFTGHLLLTARLLSVACSIVYLTLIAGEVRRLFAPAGAAVRSAAVVGSILLIAASPFFASTSGLAWNHDFSELLLVAAALLFLRRVAPRNSPPIGPWLPFVVGLLVALAAGVRLTAAPTLAAFAGMTLARRGWPLSRRWAAVAWMGAGAALGLLPCVAIAALAPRAFWFGNFEYPTLNTAWRLAEAVRESTTPWGKVTYLATGVLAVPGNGLLLVLVATVIVLAARRVGLRGHPYGGELAFLGVLLLFMAAASLAPAPLFPMYFFAPVPFLVLVCAYAAAPTPRAGTAVSDGPVGRPVPAPPRSPALLLAVLTVAAVGAGAENYFPSKLAFRPAHWVPIRTHTLGAELRRRIGPEADRRPVLTLAPIYPLESGMDVYEQYATGPFAMRVAPMVPEEDEGPLHLLDAQDLGPVLRERPPAAVVAAFEGPYDAALLRAGRAAGAPLIWLRASNRNAVIDDRANVRRRSLEALTSRPQKPGDADTSPDPP